MRDSGFETKSFGAFRWPDVTWGDRCHRGIRYCTPTRLTAIRILPGESVSGPVDGRVCGENFHGAPDEGLVIAQGGHGVGHRALEEALGVEWGEDAHKLPRHSEGDELGDLLNIFGARMVEGSGLRVSVTRFRTV